MKERFSLLLRDNDSSKIDGNIERAIYSSMVRTGGDTEWLKVHEVRPYGQDCLGLRCS
jgi:hypothetical protein